MEPFATAVAWTSVSTQVGGCCKSCKDIMSQMKPNEVQFHSAPRSGRVQVGGKC